MAGASARGDRHAVAVARACVQRKGELFPRFAAIYHRSCALPRRVRRHLQRQWACSLAGVALLFALQRTTSWAANFTAATDTELIAAINDANGNGEADIITLTADITLIAMDNTDVRGPNGLPVITSPIIIAGQGIPVKFSLGSNQGLNIFETGYPKSQQIACDTAAPADDIKATVTAENSGLSYNSSTDQYTYGWKTVTTWANTCRQFIVKLRDGAVRLANFQFKK